MRYLKALVLKVPGGSASMICLLGLAAVSVAAPPPALPCHHGGPCPPVPPQLLPRLHNSPPCLTNDGPHDVAAAITLPHPDGGLVHHVWMFCIPCINTSARSPCWYNESAHSNPNAPNGSWSLNNVGSAWQYATSRDLLRWTNHGNTIGVYSGFVLPVPAGEIEGGATGAAASGSATVCAGQRCGNTWCPGHPSCGDPRQTSCPGLVINGSGALNGSRVNDVPIFITCRSVGSNGVLEGPWQGHAYPFNPHEYRAMAFDPLAWRDADGMVYVGVATDACNGTTRAAPCAAGYGISLWRAPRLLAPPELWEPLGPMLTTAADAMVRDAPRGEMVTPSYTGGLRGDPRGGRTRLLTNNVCHGTTYWLGTQANGSRLVDGRGGWDFDAKGETGMLDWGAVVFNGTAAAGGATGRDALATALQVVPGTCHAPYSMARTFGDPSGQTVATAGRKLAVAWIGNGTFAAQSLPRELSLAAAAGADGALRLHQAWAPELAALRVPGSHARAARAGAAGGHAGTTVAGGFQVEVSATFRVRNVDDIATAAGPRRFGVRVLGSRGGSAGVDIGVDADAAVVFVDGRRAGGCDAMPWTCPFPTSPLRRDGLYPAGPLLGANDTVSVHCIVDGAYVQCIFNNLTAITAMVSPTADVTEPVEFFGSAVATLLQLESWRLALPND